ncbi:MAG: hypothetical protein Q6J68_02100 [Thermostichales cyanobacterium SZTDM-1c_bins_54]
MADIFVMIRSQENNILTSIDGEAFVTVLEQDGFVLATETVDLTHADAGFDDIPVGEYTVIVKHNGVEPAAAAYPVTVTAEDEVVLLTFTYLEPERVLLRVRSVTEKRLA